MDDTARGNDKYDLEKAAKGDPSARGSAEFLAEVESMRSIKVGSFRISSNH